MFKFKSRINDTHFFISKLSDLHKFTTKTLDMIIMKLTAINETVTPDVWIDTKKIKLLIKASFYNITQNTSYVKGTVKAKAKMTNITDVTLKSSCYQGKSKKLALYTSTKLSELPISLKGASFNFANESWEEVTSVYRTWNSVKNEFTSWEKLID